MASSSGLSSQLPEATQVRTQLVSTTTRSDVLIGITDVKVRAIDVQDVVDPDVREDGVA